MTKAEAEKLRAFAAVDPKSLALADLDGHTRWLHFQPIAAAAIKALEKQEKQIEELREALAPFALYASAIEEVFDVDHYLTPVHQYKHQAICVGAFMRAKEAFDE